MTREVEDVIRFLARLWAAQSWIDRRSTAQVKPKDFEAWCGKKGYEMYLQLYAASGITLDFEELLEQEVAKVGRRKTSRTNWSRTKQSLSGRFKS